MVFFFLIFKYLFIFETKREREKGVRERRRVGKEQTEKETQTLKQDPGSELSAQSPTLGSNPRTVGSWPELTN